MIVGDVLEATGTSRAVRKLALLTKVRRAKVGTIMRTRAHSTRDQSTSVVVLAQLAPGRRATVVGTLPQATSVIASRLGQLGFRATAQVDVIRRAPLGDPTIYRIQDTELCLRRREAQLIVVVPEPDQ
jgi:ferrous iron transport protein A